MGRREDRGISRGNGDRRVFKTFYEGDVERIKDSVGKAVPEPISFCLRSVTYKHACGGTIVNFWIVSRDESESSTFDLMDVIKGRFMSIS